MLQCVKTDNFLGSFSWDPIKLAPKVPIALFEATSSVSISSAASMKAYKISIAYSVSYREKIIRDS